MPDRARHLMELLGCHIGETEAMVLAASTGALDLDATQFLNPEPGELLTLVLAPDSHGRQLIMDRVRGGTRVGGLPSGHWRVWAEVICWTVQVSIQPQTLPGYTVPPGARGNDAPLDPMGQLCERYEPFGAHLELADTAQFPDAALAADFTTDLWALLAEHGAGATFTTTLFAKTLAVGPYLWTVKGRETLEPLVRGSLNKVRGQPQNERPGQQNKKGGQ